MERRRTEVNSPSRRTWWSRNAVRTCTDGVSHAADPPVAERDRCLGGAWPDRPARTGGRATPRAVRQPYGSAAGGHDKHRPLPRSPHCGPQRTASRYCSPATTRAPRRSRPEVSASPTCAPGCCPRVSSRRAGRRRQGRAGGRRTPRSRAGKRAVGAAHVSPAVGASNVGVLRRGFGPAAAPQGGRSHQWCPEPRVRPSDVPGASRFTARPPDQHEARPSSPDRRASCWSGVRRATPVRRGAAATPRVPAPAAT
ncbi:MAG: hypothetical protein JWP46_3804 [Modestobacter sp.]|nr:hypothetical protein [Modestobacter sp.]